MTRFMLIPVVLVSFLFVSSAFGGDEHALIAERWYSGLEPLDAGDFIDPEVCARCHRDIYDMWDGTMHSAAFDDPLFRAATKLFVSKAVHPGERGDAEHCVVCHNPIAVRSGQVKGSSGDYDAVDDVTSRAISCDLCHSIDEIVMVENTSFNTDPGNGEDDPGTKLGPRDDAAPMYHDAAYSGIHTRSEICGACHNVTHLWYLTKLEGTYDEWFHSPYNSLDPEKVVSCQDCHMRQSPGNPSTGMTLRPDYPGASSDMGPERLHIYRHSVAGANTLMPGLLGNDDSARLAGERLKHAAVIEITDVGKTGGGVTSVTVRVRNEGAGHMLPTGVTEFRQMWLEITVTDPSGTKVFSSGGIDGSGNLTPDTSVFQTVFGDPDGNPTVNVTEAAVMLTDRRVPPKGRIDTVYTFPAPVKGGIDIRAELRYRSMKPELVHALLGDDGVEVPVVTMAAVEKRVR